MTTRAKKADNPNIFMEMLVKQALELHHQGKDKEKHYKYIMWRCAGDDKSAEKLGQSKQISDMSVDARVYFLNEFDRLEPNERHKVKRDILRMALQINGQPPRSTQTSGCQPSTLRGPEDTNIRPSTMKGKTAVAQTKTSSV